MSNVPHTVTRFYGTPSFGLDVLEGRQIALVRVTVMNDPFDPYAFFETDFEKKYGRLLAYVRAHHATDLSWFRHQVTPMSLGKTIKMLEEYMQSLRKNTFVFCCSAEFETQHPKDNLYMWGHYGNGHRGLAIEFNTQSVATAVLAHHDAKGGEPLINAQPWVEMQYVSSFRPITAKDVFFFLKRLRQPNRKTTKTSLEMYYDQIAKIKGVVWQPEREWRLMWTSDTEKGSVYKIGITADCIRTVYLGLAIIKDEADRARTAVAQNYPHATVYAAAKRHGDLTIDFCT